MPKTRPNIGTLRASLSLSHTQSYHPNSRYCDMSGVLSVTSYKGVRSSKFSALVPVSWIKLRILPLRNIPSYILRLSLHDILMEWLRRFMLPLIFKIGTIENIIVIFVNNMVMAVTLESISNSNITSTRTRSKCNPILGRNIRYNII